MFLEVSFEIVCVLKVIQLTIQRPFILLICWLNENICVPDGTVPDGTCELTYVITIIMDLNT